MSLAVGHLLGDAGLKDRHAARLRDLCATGVHEDTQDVGRDAHEVGRGTGVMGLRDVAIGLIALTASDLTTGSGRGPPDFKNLFCESPIHRVLFAYNRPPPP